MSTAAAPRAATPVPGWLDALVRCAAFAVVALGLAGLPLALTGTFRPRFVAPATLVVFLALVLLWRGWQANAVPRRPRAELTAQVAGGLAVAIALASVALNVAFDSQHLLVDGDPAVYGVTGQILAHSGGLTLPTYAGSLFAGRPGINFAGAGFFLTDGGATLYPQFFHLLPALLAVGQWIGGPATMLAVNPWLGGFALLACYAFAARLVRPLWALAAMVTLAVLLPQVHFSRDMFSEIPSQLLVFAGLSLLWDVTGRRRPVSGPAQLGGALVAGLVLGGSMMVRVDAFFYLAAIGGGLLLARAGRTGLAVIAGMLLTAAVALVDGYVGSRAYVDSIAVPLAETTAAILAVGAAALYLRRDRPWVPRLGARLAGPAVTGGLLLAGYAWFVRPYVQISRDIPARTNQTIAGLQRREGLRVDVPRAYDELSMHWLQWYLGPVALAIGVLALGYYVFRLMRGRDGRLAPFVVLVLGVTAVYVWRPGIFPVQYWASRRFLPVTFPGLILLALLACQQLWDHRRRALAALGAAAVVGFPLALLPGATLPRDYVGMLPAVEAMCGSLLPHDVALLMSKPASDGLPQVVEGFCHVPAASVGRLTTPADVAAVTAAVHRAGRRLVLLSSDAQPPLAPPGVQFRQIVDVTLPTAELALSHRPEGTYRFPLRLYIAYLPPG